MTPQLWVAIIGQTVIILVAIIGVAVRGERRITTVETKVEHLESEVQPIPGLSRAVARIEGKLSDQ